METRPPAKKAKRVQSWYLYEQYKSLEKNQLDGARALRDRSCQEKILHQELEERRVRRQFCNQLGSCQSDCRMQSCIGSDAGTLASVSTDDFIDNFCGFQESDETIVNSDQTYNLCYDENKCEANENKPAVTSDEVSSTNTVEKEIDTNQTDLNKELKVVKQNIEDSVNLQLEAMKENIQCLEKYTKQTIVDKTSEEPIVKSLKHCTVYKSAEYDNNLFAIWSGLVSFAYQVMQMNRGNCYYDCSNQLLIAVLLCDILWKGVNKMCDILQPYVSPIKFENDEFDPSNVCYRNNHYTPSHLSKVTDRTINITEQPIKLQKTGRRNRKTIRNSVKCGSHACDRLQNVAAFSPRIRIYNSSTTNRWLGETNPPKRSCSQNCNCRTVNKIVNPMIKLSRYIDTVLQDLED